ncbi:MAG: hypothetical protein ABI402_14070 [Ferruginibacter sp.]
MPSQIYKISVSKPCHEDWNGMQRVNEGKYCSSCEKTVIDFSLMTDEAVQHYFINNNQAPVCGRFKNTQLDRIRIHIPTYVFQKKISPWKKYLIILLLCFGSTVFSVDVFMGGGNLYAQTQVAKKHFKKKKYKIRYTLSESINPKIFWTLNTTSTSGVVVVVPEPKIYEDPTIAIRSGSLPIDAARTIKANPDSTILAANTTHNGKDEPPENKSSKINTEFILPAPLLMRKRRRST